MPPPPPAAGTAQARTCDDDMVVKRIVDLATGIECVAHYEPVVRAAYGKHCVEAFLEAKVHTPAYFSDPDILARNPPVRAIRVGRIVEIIRIARNFLKGYANIFRELPYRLRFSLRTTSVPASTWGICTAAYDSK